MKFIPFIVLVVFAVIACAPRGAQLGDMVVFHYTLRLQDGTLAETTSREVAADAGRIIPGKEYGPLTIELGAHKTLRGLEEALNGMEKDEVKDIVLLPEQAYGPYDTRKVGTIVVRKDFPLSVSFSRILHLSRDSYPGLSVGEEFRPQENPFRYVVDSVNETTVIALVVNASVNETVGMPGTPWNGIVIALMPEIVVEAIVPDGAVIPSGLGDVIVHRTDEGIYTLLDVQVGDRIKTPVGTGNVIEMTNDSIVVDTNDPLANYTLLAHIDVVSVTAAS